MKMKRSMSILTIALLAASICYGKTKISVSRAEAVALMRKVCDYQLANPWPYEPVQNNDWQRGTFYIGVMATYRTTKDHKYLDQALRWSEETHWAPGDNPAYPANPMTCGQTYLELYFLRKDAKMISGTRQYVDKRMAMGAPGRTEWFYCDALFVAPPTLAELAVATGEKKYFEYMHRMYWDVTDALFDKHEGLYYRDKDFISQKAKNGRKVFWSRGNGWVIAGIPRILPYLSRNDPQRGRYIELLKTLAASIAPAQGADGLWRTSLLDPEEFPDPETSGSSFFCYAMAWGINHGILERARYLPVVERAWKGLTSSVDSRGKLGWVQRENKQPGPEAAEESYEYGVGAFLLAGSEVANLAK